MKNASGVCWRYRNSLGRGRMTWAAELRVGNALLCVYGQKQLRSAIAIANTAAKRLGWRLAEPWLNETRKKHAKAMSKPSLRGVPVPSHPKGGGTAGQCHRNTCPGQCPGQGGTAGQQGQNTNNL
jgi:hypothetical protein